MVSKLLLMLLWHQNLVGDSLLLLHSRLSASCKFVASRIRLRVEAIVCIALVDDCVLIGGLAVLVVI